MRWLVLVVGAAGCGFSASDGGGGGITVDSPPGAMIDAPATPGIDAAPLDAPPDARPDAPVLTWTIVDTLTVSCRGTSVTSTFVLSAGVTYRLRASGECIANTFNGSRQDAEYLGYNVGPVYDAYDNVDNGIAINDPDTDAFDKQPTWGSFNPTTHTYEVPWVGTNAPITATFHETNLSNNSGSLTLTILAFQ